MSVFYWFGSVTPWAIFIQSSFGFFLATGTAVPVPGTALLCCQAAPAASLALAIHTVWLRSPSLRLRPSASISAPLPGPLRPEKNRHHSSSGRSAASSARSAASMAASFLGGRFRCRRRHRPPPWRSRRRLSRSDTCHHGHLVALGQPHHTDTAAVAALHIDVRSMDADQDTVGR